MVNRKTGVYLAIGIACLSLLVVIVIAKWSMPTLTFDQKLELTKAVVSVVGTLATIVGGVFLYLNFTIATKNARTALETLKVTQAKLEQDEKKAAKDAELAESRLITDRFSKAVEQLGSDKIEVRLGGIYALERIAQDSDRDYWTIMEVLTSFVQERSPLESANQNQIAELSLSSVITDVITKDVQAALTVIGRREVRKDPVDKSIDLSGANLSGANLALANLSKAHFKGTNLSNAKLIGANLTDAYFVRANLSHANLSGADLSKTNLRSATLKYANLYETNLSAAFVPLADLSNVQLNDAKGITKAEAETAYLCQTILPDGTKSDRDCRELGIEISENV